MPRCFPDELDADVPASESTMFEALRRQLPDDAALFHGVAFTDDQGECEADIVVAWPGYGLAVVECKGGHVTVVKGQWQQNDATGSRSIDPVKQAQRASHGLSRFLQHAGWSRAYVVSTVHLVAAPFTRFGTDVAVPELPRQRLLGRDDVAHAAERIALALRSGPGQPETLSADEVDFLCEKLAATFPTQSSLLSVAEEDAARCLQLTRNQLQVLDQLARNNRLEVRGGAGTGKTFVALEKARRLAKDGREVALTCYSRGLAHYLQGVTQTWPARERPTYVGTFHGLAVRFGIPEERARDDEPHYWEVELPAELERRAAEATAAVKLADVVIDEAQDFAEAWWPALLACLRDRATGGVYVFSDPEQRVFSRYGEPPAELGLLAFDLDQNVRNTKNIGQTFSSLTTCRLKWRNPAGLPVRFEQCASGDAVSVADDAVEELLEQGWEPGHLALLTTHHRHPQQKHATDQAGLAAYWEEFFAEADVFYGNTLNFKGLERPVVVLAVNGFRDDGREREKLYVGLSRARSRSPCAATSVRLRGWAVTACARGWRRPRREAPLAAPRRRGQRMPRLPNRGRRRHRPGAPELPRPGSEPPASSRS